jgi:hypothetical protein
MFEMADGPFFQIALRIFILEIQELENVGIVEFLFGSDLVFRRGSRRFGKHIGFVFR